MGIRIQWKHTGGFLSLVKRRRPNQLPGGPSGLDEGEGGTPPNALQEDGNRRKETMETDMTDLKRAEDACKWFLNTYNEASTTRVSREAFESVMHTVGAVAMAHHSKHCKMEKHHPLIVCLYHDVNSERVCIVHRNLGTGEMFGVKETRANALEQMGKVPGELDDLSKAAFAALFVIRPKRLTLEELDSWGIRPYAIVQHVKNVLDHLIFSEAMEHTTMPPALA